MEEALMVGLTCASALFLQVGVSRLILNVF